MARPLLCTGGAVERKHDEACDGCTTRIARLPGATTCVGSKHFTIRSVQGHYACRSSTIVYMYHCPLLTTELTTLRHWFMHNPCLCNHVNAAFGRVGKCVPLANDEVVTRLLRPIGQLLAGWVGRHPPVAYREIYMPLDAKKRASYERAEQNLIRRGHVLTQHDARVTAFVKLEGIKFGPEKVNPDCRMIQFRSKEYTLKLASIIRRAEHATYKARDVLCPGPHFAKNKNTRMRAADLRELYEMGFDNIMEMDASRFDAHFGVSLNRMEAEYIQATSHGHQLEEMLRWQQDNRGSFTCRTDAGTTRVNYRVKGGRMSGDANTAYGNCVMMAEMLTAFGRSLGVRFSFYCDGDDSVFFYDGPPISDEHVRRFFREFGMTMGVENRPTKFEHIGFCQSRPVYLNGSWTMVRDPFKILSKMTVSHKLREVKGRASYLRTCALGELSMLRGCPVVQPFLLQLIKTTEARMSKRSRNRVHAGALASNWRLRNWLAKDWRVAKALPITHENRKSFEETWGVTIEQQIAFEDQISRWTTNLQSTTPGQGVDVDRWEYPWRRDEMQ